MTIGEKIRLLRQQADLSQAQLADAISVSRAAVAKWENENGTPGLDNLKALAQYFSCDLAMLVDNNRSLEGLKATEPLPDTFCGKNCLDCPHRDALKCPGCKQGPGKMFQEDCDIAKCARKKSPYGCAVCDNKAYCATLRRSERIPKSRIERNEREAEAAYRRVGLIASMEKSVWPLFWLSLIYVLLSHFATDSMETSAHTAYMVFTIIKLLLLTAICFFQIRMGRAHDGFTKAGIFRFLTVLMSVLELILAPLDIKMGWQVLMAIVSYTAITIAYYCEFQAYAKVLAEFDYELAIKWDKLCILMVLGNIGALAGVVIAMLFKLLGVLLVLVCSIAVLIGQVLELIYRHRTAKTIA